MSDQIIITQDGSHSIFSKQFGVSYHSKYGAIQETQHVFINAGLCYKAPVQRELTILDIGFGTGLNAYMTLLEGLKRDLQITYVAYEAYPISVEQAQTLNYAQLVDEQDTSSFFSQLHAAPWNRPTSIHQQFIITKRLAPFQSINATDKFDIIYFDAFAPSSQPELWKTPLLGKMYAALKPSGVLVTYCAKGQVKRNLKEVGFKIEKLKGPPGKREMTRALKNV